MRSITTTTRSCSRSIRSTTSRSSMLTFLLLAMVLAIGYFTDHVEGIVTSSSSSSSSPAAKASKNNVLGLRTVGDMSAVPSEAPLQEEEQDRQQQLMSMTTTIAKNSILQTDVPTTSSSTMVVVDPTPPLSLVELINDIESSSTSTSTLPQQDETPITSEINNESSSSSSLSVNDPILQQEHSATSLSSLQGKETSSSNQDDVVDGVNVNVGPWETMTRGLQISNIIFGKIVLPLLSSLRKQQQQDRGGKGSMIMNWDEFWNSTPYAKATTNAMLVALAIEELGPTYVKFGQALSARPDVIPRPLANALSTLQDSMQPFDTTIAQEIIRKELTSHSSLHSTEIEELVQSLSSEPVAAASIGQVYSAYLPISSSSSSSERESVTISETTTKQHQYQKVAIKVKRPGIREIVEQDAALLRSTVTCLESLPAIPNIQTKQSRLIATELVQAVDEFMSRIFEELDYLNEAKNIEIFSNLYSHRRKHTKYESSTNSNINVVVPNVYPTVCTENVLIMEWINGTKLVDEALLDPSSKEENLKVIEQGIQCTLSQLLDTGVMHADPHQGNLLKVKELEKDKTGSEKVVTRLGYVDFGLLSSIPPSIRDGLVCAVTQLIFARDVDAVAALFGELSLLPDEVLDDPTERAAFSSALTEVLDQVLVYDTDGGGEGERTTTIPNLRFDKLLDALTRLVPRFRFELPPYFINNARALSTLEGMARELNPSFNVLQVLYPYALNRLLSNPNNSPVVESTLQALIRSPRTGRVDVKRVQKVLEDSAFLTGYSKRKVLRDILSSNNGARLARLVAREELTRPWRRQWSKPTNLFRL